MSGGKPSVMILCGGTGTRLREETEFRPKPMVAIGGRPILWHIMKHYATHGFDDFVVCLGYKGQVIKQYFLDYDRILDNLMVRVGSDTPPEKLGGDTLGSDRFDVRLIETGADTMTGGRVLRAAPFLKAGTFMVTYGDAVSDVDLRELLRFHRTQGRLATVTAVHPDNPYGEIDIGPDNLALRFREKPRMPNVWVNGGYFVFEPQALEYLRADEPEALVLEREPLERLVAAGELSVYRHERFWSCMDTFKDVERLNGLWNASPHPPWKVW